MEVFSIMDGVREVKGFTNIYKDLERFYIVFLSVGVTGHSSKVSKELV